MTGADRKRVVEGARRLAEAAGRLALLRDYPRQPVYVVWSHEAGLPIHRHTYGVCGFDLDRVCRPALERAGRWQGRGPTALLNLGAVLRDHRRRGPVAWRNGVEAAVVAVSIHELAHAVRERYGYADDEPDGKVGATATAMRTAWAAPAPRRGGTVAELPAWSHHDAGFVRAALHLWHRAGPALALRFGDVVDTARYNLSPAGDYAQALRREVESLVTMPVRDVLGLPPPPEFASLWAGDVRRWRQSLTGGPTASVRAALLRRGITV